MADFHTLINQTEYFVKPKRGRQCLAKHYAVTFVISAALALAGCYRAYESQPYFKETGEWKTDGPRFIAGPGIRITMKVSNYKLPITRAQDDFLGISLLFEPSLSGFEFNPNETYLRIGDTRLAPSEVHIEYAGNNFRTIEWTCGKYPPRDFGKGPFYEVVRGACFELYFKTSPPSPQTPFSMRIGGLRQRGTVVDVPDLYFRQGSFWVFDFLGH